MLKFDAVAEIGVEKFGVTCPVDSHKDEKTILDDWIATGNLIFDPPGVPGMNPIRKNSDSNSLP